MKLIVVVNQDAADLAVSSLAPLIPTAAVVQENCVGDLSAWRFELDTVSADVRAAIDAWCMQHRADRAWFEQRPHLTDFKLLVMDMDSTLVTIETIDEIADFCGRKAEVAAITEAAMRGEISDYSESLRRRVALLDGLPVASLEAVYQERMHLSPGAQALISHCHEAGLSSLLVSGGFTYFTERLAKRLDLRHTRANTLGVMAGKLDGSVRGEIVDASVKARTVREVCTSLGIEPAQAIVIGDGANDLKMMALAGLSVAYHAKPIVRSQTTVAIDHHGLDALLLMLD